MLSRSDVAPRDELAGRIVTFDALHAQQATAQLLCETHRAEYVVTAIKANQPTMLEDLQDMDFTTCPTGETLDNQRGRIVRRRYWVKDLCDPGWKDYAKLQAGTRRFGRDLPGRVWSAPRMNDASADFRLGRLRIIAKQS